MTGRDDSLLYSGSSSVSFGVTHEQAKRTEKSEEKKENRGKLKPSADIVFSEIQREMQDVMSVINIGVEYANDERLFMTEVMARKRYVEYLKRLQNKLNNILREPVTKTKPVKDEEESENE